MKLHHSTPYQNRRKGLYPRIEDQLDAIWKGGDDFQEMQNNVLKVKQKHPKQELENE